MNRWWRQLKFVVTLVFVSSIVTAFVALICFLPFIVTANSIAFDHRHRPYKVVKGPYVGRSGKCVGHAWGLWLVLNVDATPEETWAEWNHGDPRGFAMLIPGMQGLGDWVEFNHCPRHWITVWRWDLERCGHPRFADMPDGEWENDAPPAYVCWPKPGQDARRGYNDGLHGEDHRDWVILSDDRPYYDDYQRGLYCGRMERLEQSERLK